MDKAYAHCKQILSDNKEKMRDVVEFLLKHENMTGAQFTACMEGEPIEEDARVSLFEVQE